jgi:hypothetical protein
MGTERKSIMFSVRVPTALAARLDYVMRNLDVEGVTNRSTAVCAAMNGWLAEQERKLVELGVLTKKNPR